MKPLLRAAIAMLALCPVGALATPPLQKKAKDAGFPSDNCGYCHSFDSDHMRAKAKSLGMEDNLNCMRCHGARLPKMGARLFNPRGLYLVGRKLQTKAREVDVQWLKDYVEEHPKGGGQPQPRP